MTIACLQSSLCQLYNPTALSLLNPHNYCSNLKGKSLNLSMAARLAALASSLFIVLSLFQPSSINALSNDYYDKSCPKAEAAVTAAVKKATANDKTVPAALLRMHFHDCFIRGCDGSVLLKSTKKNTAERDGPPNISLHAFYVIDNAKKAVENICPGVVSCADILALAARDAVALSGGPTWEVPMGRKDGRISLASDTRQLPAPTFNFTQLKQSFQQRGLSTSDLVALSGGHTLGFAHCSSFQNRIHNFNASNDVDPSLSTSFAASLTQDMSRAQQGRSLFSSDQALLTQQKTKQLLSQFAASEEAFNNAFVKSMIRMSSLTGGQEIRLDCNMVRMPSEVLCSLGGAQSCRLPRWFSVISFVGLMSFVSPNQKAAEVPPTISFSVKEQSVTEVGGPGPFAFALLVFIYITAGKVDVEILKACLVEMRDACLNEPLEGLLATKLGSELCLYWHPMWLAGRRDFSGIKTLGSM
ncbi:hypothetical protein HPP92_022750 [Vanilla planifolia]|uniref:Peroxidase 1 n=1 Tax=Vanilla planifolia TaxID=51239 RepID=A0A835PUP6_VANPL|nr:hypothetical protein HPP92_022750 [Vanilla planifolia]